MYCVAIGLDNFCAGVLTLHHFDCCVLGHPLRDGKVYPVAPCVGAVAGVCQSLGNQGLLVLLRPEATCWGEARLLKCWDRVKVSAETHQ